MPGFPKALNNDNDKQDAYVDIYKLILATIIPVIKISRMKPVDAIKKL